MGRESETIKQIEREDRYEEAGELEAKLLPELKELSQELNIKGFPVDEECRIRPEVFKDIFGEHAVLADKKVGDREKESIQDKPNVPIGELLEIAKTITFNKLWFKGRLIALRTSKFDDVLNGVDEVIFDTETHQPLAAVDTTTNVKDKEGEIFGKIRKGSQVKYGFYIKDGIKKGSLTDLPTFIISLRSKELLEFAQKIINHPDDKKFDLKTEKNILESLKLQSEEFQKIADSRMKHSYEAAGQIFNDLLKSESYENSSN